MTSSIDGSCKFGVAGSVPGRQWIWPNPSAFLSMASFFLSDSDRPSVHAFTFWEGIYWTWIPL